MMDTQIKKNVKLKWACPAPRGLGFQAFWLQEVEALGFASESLRAVAGLVI